MKRPNITSSTFVSGCVVAVSTILVLAARTEATTVVSPPGFEDTDGNIRFFPGTPYPQSPGDVDASTFRFQELHPASAFNSLGTGPLTITSLAWRPDVSVNEPISDEWEFTLSLSTTDVGTLSHIFAENIGERGEAQVFSGVVQLQTDGVPRGPGLPHEFDYFIEFDTPFLYFPQEGDLLIDAVFEVPLDDPWIWVDADDRTGEYVEAKPNGPLATRGGPGLFVTQFTIVPEPSSWVLGLLLCAGVVAQGTRRRIMMPRVLAFLIATMLCCASEASAYTFGDWAHDQGYNPGDALPSMVVIYDSGVDSLDGIGEFDWTTTPTTSLSLNNNNISSIESGNFAGLDNLERLELIDNEITSIERSDFDGLNNLSHLDLSGNAFTSIGQGDFSGLTNLMSLALDATQLSSVPSGVFSALTELEGLSLNASQILSSIDSGAFSGLTNLNWLSLGSNPALTELNFAEAEFSSLQAFDVGGNVNVTSVSLKNSVVNQTSLHALLWPDGFIDHTIGNLDGITKLDLSGMDFSNYTSLGPVYTMDDLTDLWLVNTANLDALHLDQLLDNLATIEGTSTEGVLYMTRSDFDAFNTAGGGLLAAWDAEPGHHVEFVVPEPTSWVLCLWVAMFGIYRRGFMSRPV